MLDAAQHNTVPELSLRQVHLHAEAYGPNMSSVDLLKRLWSVRTVADTCEIYERDPIKLQNFIEGGFQEQQAADTIDSFEPKT